MRNQNKCKNEGFTLLELMIVVAIIGIIAAVAFPSYRESVAKGNRSDAIAALIAFQGAMERHYTETNSYCDAAQSSGSNSCGDSSTKDTGKPDIFSDVVPIDGGDAYYNLTISAVTANSYTLTATRTGSMSNDRCGDFSITNIGVKSIANQESGVTASDCWRK